MKAPQRPPQKRALVIESDPAVADLLIAWLRHAPVQAADHAADGATGLAMGESFDYALVTLELMLPKLGGPALCRALRETRRETPLLAVTARADAIPDLLGNRAGVDDYVIKPLAEREFLRKAEALLARPRISMEDRPRYPSSSHCIGPVTFLPSTRTLIIEEKTICNFSLAEFELLQFLASNPGVPFSEEELLQKVWGLQEPVKLKHLSVDLSGLRRRIRGMSSGLRYVHLRPDGRTEFHAPGAAW